MRKVYYTLDLTEAVLVKDQLRHNGVAASVRNEGAVRIPYTGIASEVWVDDAADHKQVRELIHGFLKERTATGDSGTAWTCRRCYEENPGNFDVCWNCTEARRTRDEPGSH